MIKSCNDYRIYSSIGKQKQLPQEAHKFTSATCNGKCYLTVTLQYRNDDLLY